MIKLKRIIALSVLIFGLYSCTKDEATTVSIEGKWEDYKTGEIIDGKEVLKDINSYGCTKNYIEILAGGTFTQFYFNDTNIKCEPTTDSGRWTKVNNTLTLSDSDGSKIYEILELSSTIIKVQFKYTELGKEYTGIFISKRI